MIYTGLNRTGEVTDVKAHGGGTVSEVYGSIGEANPIYYKNRTLNGTPPLSFKALGKPLISYQIYGNMTQNGTPTPDDPIVPQECGDRTENLIDTNDPTAINNRYISGDGIIASSGGWWVSGYIPIEQGERYTAKNAQLRYLFYSTKGGTSTFMDSDPNYGFTVPDGVNYVRVWGKKNSVMLVKGSTVPSSYVPYGYRIPITCGGETKTVYLDEPLRKIGNYADEIDFKTGTVTRRVRKVELTGSETIEESVGRWIVRAGLINSVLHIGKSTHFSNKSWGTVTWFDNAFSIEDSSIFFGVTSMFVSMNAFRQLLTDSYTDGNPVTVYYASTRPITEAVTLPQIPTISGQNTLSFGTALQPSSVSVTGHIKPVTS